MPFTYGIAWGTLSMLSWGVADYLARHFSVRIGSYRTAFYVQLLGIFPLLLYLLVQETRLDGEAAPDWTALTTLGTALGLLWTIAYLTYYRGLERGMVSVVTAVASAWLAVSVLVATLLLGEVLTAPQVLLIAAITIGILLLSLRSTSRDGGPTGFWYGLGAMAAVGVGAALLKPLSLAAGPGLAILVSKVVTVVLLWIFGRARGLSLSWPTGRGNGVLLVAATLDSLAFLFYAIGVSSAPIFVIAPLAAAHPIITMALAWLLIRERPSRLQRGGIVVTLAGVIALSALTGA